MPKLKTHRGAAKRFKVSGTGKLIRSKAYKSHLLTHKNRKRKRRLKRKAVVTGAAVQALKRILPYS
ncbi:50S ribosomal protein L35 [Thermodesulforhabdus norvegica]|uniref:Large ribosomal subunit protein bL35 n=1 Tax=Thermodesulforhabdus norvegica TaxID=39841 RepID=A0A1I4SN23_9BACT|nr:50S ribosomal protein L35 [Thermodesulforhabdus norvegica]SFM65864.1 large subunit ribosomal protein L35 [Thermodesulforhabdus norvegica]